MNFFDNTTARKALSYGVGAAALRTGSVLLAHQVPVMTRINPAFGVAGTFISQLLTVGAVTSGALCTFYTTRAVATNGREEEKEK